jgi:hypothetical protein
MLIGIVFFVWSLVDGASTRIRDAGGASMKRIVVGVGACLLLGAFCSCG